MPANADNIKYLYMVATHGNPTINWDAVATNMNLSKGAVSKRFSRLKSVMEKNGTPPDSTYDFLWLCVKHSTRSAPIRWNEIGASLGLTAGAASKRYSRMKTVFEQSAAAPGAASPSPAKTPAVKATAKPVATPKNTKKTPAPVAVKEDIDGEEDTPKLTPKRKRATPKKQTQTTSSDDEKFQPPDDDDDSSYDESPTKRKKISKARPKPKPTPTPKPTPRAKAASKLLRAFTMGDKETDEDEQEEFEDAEEPDITEHEPVQSVQPVRPFQPIQPIQHVHPIQPIQTFQPSQLFTTAPITRRNTPMSEATTVIRSAAPTGVSIGESEPFYDAEEQVMDATMGGDEFVLTDHFHNWLHDNTV